MTHFMPMNANFANFTQTSLYEVISAPKVPQSVADIMPDKTDDFGSAFLELLKNIVQKLQPELAENCRLCLAIVACAMLFSLLNSVSPKVKRISAAAGAFLISSLLVTDARFMVLLASDTIVRLSDYGKLLFPVMTTAMAAQGGITASAALYAGTAAFDSILCGILSKLLVPMVYMFLALAIGNSATGEDYLKHFQDLLKSIIGWSLKLLLTVFTTYMSITGVVSGATDAAALKATKVTISTVVPVVGGILSDASEAVLVGAGLMKNAAGIYGIIAIWALFAEPFLKIGAYYLVLKISTAVCGVFASKDIAGLIESFGTAMGLLLAMTGTVCMLLMVSAICFLKGVG